MAKDIILRFKTCAMVHPNGSGRTERIIATVLVEMELADGKPEQRPVKYLGMIREREIMNPHHQARFWSRVSTALDEAGIDVDEREKIERQIRALIPRPSTFDP